MGNVAGRASVIESFGQACEAWIRLRLLEWLYGRDMTADKSC